MRLVRRTRVEALRLLAGLLVLRLRRVFDSCLSVVRFGRLIFRAFALRDAAVRDTLSAGCFPKSVFES